MNVRVEYRRCGADRSDTNLVRRGGCRVNAREKTKANGVDDGSSSNNDDTVNSGRNDKNDDERGGHNIIYPFLMSPIAAAARANSYTSSLC